MEIYARLLGCFLINIPVLCVHLQFHGSIWNASAALYCTNSSRHVQSLCLCTKSFFGLSGVLFLSPRFKNIVIASVSPSVMLSTPKPLNEIQPNLACEFHINGACNSRIVFGHAPLGPWGGIKRSNILRKTIEGYLDSVPSFTFNTIKTKLIMHAFHSSRYLQSK